MFTIHGQIGHNSGNISPAGVFDDLTTPEGALAHWRGKARELVSMLAARKHNGNRETAIWELTRHYKFPSTWLDSLNKDSKRPTLHYHLILRLERAIDREIVEQEKRIQHAKLLRKARQDRAASAIYLDLDEERSGRLHGQVGNQAGAL